MNCKDAEKLIAAFLDGELTDKEQDLVREHIATCQRCREEVEALARTQNSLRRVLKLEAAKYIPSPNAWGRLRQRITKEEQPEVATSGLAGSILKAIKRIGMGRLISRRLSWKTVLVGILALALVVSLAVMIPSLFGQDPKALAADITFDSPEVQAALSDKKLEEVQVTDVFGDSEHTLVVLRVVPDYVLIADVNLEIKEVMQVHVLELNYEKKQEMFDIAKVDPRVQDLLEQGAYISSFYPVYIVNLEEIVGPDGEIYREVSVEFIVDMRMELGEKEYLVVVDLTRGEVVQLIEPTN